MKKIKTHVIVFVGCVILCSLLFAQEKNPVIVKNIDFSGAERFLALTTTLEKDHEPAPAEWDALFETPGYAVLIQSEFRRSFFMERFRLAFMPSKKQALEKKLAEEKGYIAGFLPHYIKAKEMRQDIEAQIRNLKTMSFVESAVKEALAFLPEFELKEYPPLSFVIFGPDARGYSPVVIDVLYSIEKKDFLIPFIAHEFHHYYRNKLYVYRQEQDILWVIDQLQGEGIADQINVGKWFHNQQLYPENAKQKRNQSYLEWYAKSPQIIQAMDDLFMQMAEQPEKRGRLGVELRQLIPRSGHPTGFFMANLIIAELGKARLRRSVGNPFAFFTLYREAALKKGDGDGFPPLSEKAIDFIKYLEKKYLK